jgi:hypothetical protein
MRPAARVVVGAVFAAVVVCGPVHAGRYELIAQNTQVKDLLPRVGEYIRAFVAGFSNVVAEESYKQQIPSPRRKRELKSDLMLVKYPGADGWLIFRDTFEVDGKSVRSEPERLTKLFVEPPESALRRAREITSASAKFNLANIGTINNPLMVLALMQEENQARFRFTLGNMEKSLGPDVRIIQFQEYQSPSLLKVNGSADVFTNGLLWVEQASGRVVKTQLNLGRRGSGIEIVATFRADPDLQIDVPVSLKEWYPDGFGGDITGEATYSRFRRFQVATQDDLKQ